MNQALCNMEASIKSRKTGRAAYVVYVPDQGKDVYDGEQMLKWGAFVHVEAVYIDGVMVTEPVAA